MKERDMESKKPSTEQQSNLYLRQISASSDFVWIMLYKPFTQSKSLVSGYIFKSFYVFIITRVSGVKRYVVICEKNCWKIFA